MQDVFAADETKVHTLSRQAIARLLDDAERAVPSPPSGIRMARGSAEELDTHAQEPEIPRAGGVPKLWGEADEEEPTQVSSARNSAPRPQLVTQLMASAPPAREKPPIITIAIHAVPPAEPRDRLTIVIGVVAFFATLLPSLLYIFGFLG